MEVRTLRREGLLAAPIVIYAMIVIAVILMVFMLVKCETGDCELFGSTSLKESIKDNVNSAKAVDIANQFFHGHATEDGTPITVAFQRYAYCREGPGEVGQYRCTNTPTKDELEDSVKSFTPYPKGYTRRSSFFRNFAYRVVVSRGGEDLLDVTSGNMGSGSKSTVIFMEPLAGAENIKVKMIVNKGNVVMGVE